MTHFWKAHGLGNDFVVVDWRGRPDIPAEVTRRVCARYTGIGADGILAWVDSPGSTPFMRVFNADGSVADMCGNGLRCFVYWLVETQGADPGPMDIGSDAGPQPSEAVMVDGEVRAVRVDLGKPQHFGVVNAAVGEETYRGRGLFLGNPHYVIPRAPTVGEAGGNGPELSTHPVFARGTNVEWLEVLSESEANVVVYERGCGLTQACGTGGGGAVAVGVALERLASETDITVHLPGGDLIYRVDERGHVWMTGPAEIVFEGETTLL